MIKKTEGVLQLVKDVLRTFSEPFGEDIIEDVCLAIENNPNWYRRYNELIDELDRLVVNSRIGFYTKDLTGLHTLRVVDAKRSKIIKYYTKLI